MNPKQLVDHNPELVEDLLKLHKKRKFDLVEKKVKKELEIFPEDSWLLNLLGTSQAQRGLLKESLESFDKAIIYAENKSTLLNNLAISKIKLLKFEEARKDLEKAIEINPAYSQAYFNLANTYRQLGKIEEAIINYDQAIKHKPNYAQAYLYKSLTLKNTGDFKEAKESCLKALENKPDYGIAHRHLSSFRDYKDKQDWHLKKMLDLYKVKSLKDQDRIQLCFGIAKALEQIGDYSQSFSFLLEGNKLHRNKNNYASLTRERYFNNLKKVSDEFLLKEQGKVISKDQLGEDIIFVTGMPRSGTTLLEQILSSHTKVYGAGELRFFRDSLNEVFPESKGKKFPLNILDENKQLLKQVGRKYLNYISKIHLKEGPRIVDKMPYNFMYLGFISSCLPNAKIILIERNSLDNCYSIFKQKFGKGNDYAYSLEEIGHYFNLYQDIVNYWETFLGEKIHKVSYERLVSNQEETTRELLEFCDLDWQDNCLLFYKNKREVNTASSVQVRKPIYKDSVNLWQNYKNELRPLIEILKT